MYTLTLICVTMVLSQVSLATKTTPPLILAPSGDNNCQGNGLQCSDCETIQYCSNQAPLFQLKCSEQSKGRPYCDSTTNSCVKTKPEVCNVNQPTFVCPNTGTYPDLDNCKNYFVCDENKIATNEACPIGQIYDQISLGCVAGKTCKSYSSKTGLCKSKINKLVAYAPSRNLYILCLSARPSMLFECPIQGHVFDEEEASCRFECTQSGYFVNYEDRSKFYSCTPFGKKFIVSVLQCPAGTEFVQLTPNQGICTQKEPEIEGSGEVPEVGQQSEDRVRPVLVLAENESTNEDSVESVEN